MAQLSFVEKILAFLGVSKKKVDSASNTAGNKSARSKNAPSKSASNQASKRTSKKPAGMRSGSDLSVNKAKIKKAQSIPEATPEQIEQILNYKGKLLTSETGPIEVSRLEREQIVLLENGYCLLSSETDSLHPVKHGVKTRIIRSGKTIKRELLVSKSVLKKVYLEFEKRRTSNEARSSNKDDSQMRNDFIAMIEDLYKRKATDFHIELTSTDAAIRIRVNGDMIHYDSLERDYAESYLAAIFYMTTVSDAMYNDHEGQAARVSTDIQKGIELPDEVEAIRLQYNPLPQGGRHLAGRILPSQKGQADRDLDSLGYSQRHLTQIKRMRKTPEGIITISGPTGSGKSTTLQLALSALIAETRGTITVLTIEDPPEYIIEGAYQLAVTNADTDAERRAKFGDCIRRALRSDPDVIMIGEVRDGASAELALEAAMTGHPVWTSLHANDAMSIIDRYRQKGLDPYDLADPTLVVGLIGQRLLRVMCDHCKRPLNEAIDEGDVLDEITLEGLTDVIGQEHFDKIYVASDKGCPHCTLGTKGRTVAAETIIPDYGFMSLIYERKKMEARDYWLEKLGGMTMAEHAASKMLSGTVDPRAFEHKVGPILNLSKDRVNFILEVADLDKVKG